MSCSQCFTAQVPECLELLGIYTSLIDITNDEIVVIKIVNPHGNVYLIEGTYSDGMVSVDFTNELLPKNLFNRYSGAMTIEVLNNIGGLINMVICGKEYTCITLDVIYNNLSLPDYIGCRL